MLIDSHCHLDRLDYGGKHQDLADMLNKAKARGVSHFLSVSVTLDHFPAMRQLIEPHANVFASCGVHPLDQETPWEPAQLPAEVKKDKPAEPRREADADKRAESPPSDGG